MPNRRMLPDTVTLYNYVGEDKEGRAEYEVTVLRNVYCSERFGTEFDDEGKDSSDKSKLYIFDANTVALSLNGRPKKYLPYNEWVKSKHKSIYWTLSYQGDDYFANGVHAEERPQEVRTIHKILNAIRYKAGQRRMWHWTVTGR